MRVDVFSHFFGLHPFELPEMTWALNTEIKEPRAIIDDTASFLFSADGDQAF